MDAAFLVEPFTSQVLATGQAKILINTVDVAPKHPWYLVVARADWVKEHPALAMKVVTRVPRHLCSTSASDGPSLILQRDLAKHCAAKRSSD